MYPYMYIVVINEKRGFAFERKQGAYGGFGRRKGIIDIIPQIKEIKQIVWASDWEQNKTKQQKPL